jgi:hypothetical protein
MVIHVGGVACLQDMPKKQVAALESGGFRMGNLTHVVVQFPTVVRGRLSPVETPSVLAVYP